ncbi:Chaperone protein ClpB [compost metagenome]
MLARTKNEVFEILKKNVRPEFLNRIDEVVIFSPLSRDHIGEIVRIQFASVQRTLLEIGIEMEATDEALDWLAQLGYDPQFGARPLKRVMQKRILNELSKQILSGKVQKDSRIQLDMFDKQFVFYNVKEGEKEVS